MSWFSRLFKTERPRVLFSFQRPGQPVAWERNYDNYSKEGYRKNVIAYRCVSMIAIAGAGIPWVCYTKAGRKRKQEIEDHPVLDLLDKPNPSQAGVSFMEAVIAYREISGNSYLIAVGAPNPNRPPVELWTLRPNMVKVIPGPKGGIPQGFRYGDSQNYTDYPVDPITGVSDILQMKNFHPTDPWYGMSPIEAAAFSVDQHNESGKWNASLMQNSAMPSGALVMQITDKNPTGKLGEQEFQRLKEDIETRFTGPSHSGRPMLLEGGLDWKQMSLTPKDMDWVNSKNTSARDICLAFGVPPQLIGIPGDNTYSNYKEARLAFYEETVLPLMDSVQAELNAWLMPRYESKLELAYDKDEIEALGPKREAVWARIQTATHLTVNEKRHATGYDELDPEDGGDQILVPTSMTTLQSVAKDSEEPPKDNAEKRPVGETGDEGIDDDDDEAEGGNDSDPAANEADADVSKSVKLFNLPGPRSKRKEWKRQDRMRTKYVNQTRALVKAMFRVEKSRVVHAVQGKSPHEAMMIASREISDHMNKSFRPMLERQVQKCAYAFGNNVIEQASQFNKSMIHAYERKDAQSKFDSFMNHWIKNHVGDQISGIEETSRDRVIKAIREAHAESVEEGEGVVSYAEKIEDVYGEFTASRATTIARTEMGTASNYASLQAAKSTGIDGLSKEWVAVNDDRTRDDHAEVNGTIVPIDEKFQVGDDEMVGPHDPDAEPGNVINCRCALIYSKGSEE